MQFDELKRREFITLLGGAAAAGSVFWPLVARAQASSKRPTIAWIAPGTREVGASFIQSFLRGMREFGHVEGRSFDNMVYRFADGYQERLPALTEEVVRLKPDVILASAVAATVAARKATSTIPIVTPALADAVHLGLIGSEARPGGNVTGIEPYIAGLPAKQIEFAREMRRQVPRFCSLKDAINVRRALTERIDRIWPVGDQATNSLRSDEGRKSQAGDSVPPI